MYFNAFMGMLSFSASRNCVIYTLTAYMQWNGILWGVAFISGSSCIKGHLYFFKCLKLLTLDSHRYLSNCLKIICRIVTNLLLELPIKCWFYSAFMLLPSGDLVYLLCRSMLSRWGSLCLRQEALRQFKINF